MGFLPSRRCNSRSGVATLLLVVPIPLAAAHQGGAVLLLTAAIALRHTLRPSQLDVAASAAI